MRALGGEVYAISSEPQVLAARARREWSLGFETVGDPHHEIAEVCRQRGWLDLVVNERLGFLLSTAEQIGEGRDWKPTHPKGFFQPGILALRQDATVLYRWRGIPTHKNMGGAIERPTPAWVWKHLEAALDAGDKAVDAPLDRKPELDSRGIPWILFASLLIANGWFIRPRGFSNARLLPYAAARLVAFVLGWVAAFAFLPALPVALGLAAWVAWIAPRVRWLGREFQQVEAE